MQQRTSHSSAQLHQRPHHRPAVPGATAQPRAVAIPKPAAAPIKSVPAEQPGASEHLPPQMPAEPPPPALELKLPEATPPAQQANAGTELRFDLPEQLETMVAGCAGWAVSAKRKKRKEPGQQIDLSDAGQQAACWRWNQGQLRQGNGCQLKTEEQNRALAGYTVMNDTTPAKPLRHIEL